MLTNKKRQAEHPHGRYEMQRHFQRHASARNNKGDQIQ